MKNTNNDGNKDRSWESIGIDMTDFQKLMRHDNDQGLPQQEFESLVATLL
jgi:hypothetical protein